MTSTMGSSDIPERWVKHYIDQLLEVAKLLPDGAMKQATLLRADHAMDLVEAHREYKKEHP